MKTGSIISTVIAGITLSSGVLGGTMFQELTNERGDINSAIAASPRAKEEFPWLTRSLQKPAAGSSQHASGVATTATSSGYFGASPRIIEEFPQLARTEVPEKSNIAFSPNQGTTGRGLVANPRALEENPALNRGTVKTEAAPQFQIAPLKQR